MSFFLEDFRRMRIVNSDRNCRKWELFMRKLDEALINVAAFPYQEFAEGNQEESSEYDSFSEASQLLAGLGHREFAIVCQLYLNKENISDTILRFLFRRFVSQFLSRSDNADGYDLTCSAVVPEENVRKSKGKARPRLSVPKPGCNRRNIKSL